MWMVLEHGGFDKRRLYWLESEFWGFCRCVSLDGSRKGKNEKPEKTLKKRRRSHRQSIWERTIKIIQINKDK